MPITTTIAVVLPRIQKKRRCNRLRPCRETDPDVKPSLATTSDDTECFRLEYKRHLRAQAEGGMDDASGIFGIFRVDPHRNLNLGRTDKLNIHTGFG